MPKPPRQQKNVSVNSFQTGLAACFSVCVCVFVFVCVCVTQAPMWRAQAASLTMSHNSSKSGPRYGRSVSSSSPLIGLDWSRVEVTCCVIGWNLTQWKIYPFPFLPFLQCSGMWLCARTCTYSTYTCNIARVRTYLRVDWPDLLCSVA